MIGIRRFRRSMGQKRFVHDHTGINHLPALRAPQESYGILLYGITLTRPFLVLFPPVFGLPDLSRLTSREAVAPSLLKRLVLEMGWLHTRLNGVQAPVAKRKLLPINAATPAVLFSG